MARFVSGEIVVIPFPFTDLSSSKVRPAIVLASFNRGDVLLCQTTSQSAGHPDAIRISLEDLQPGGGLSRESYALPHRLVTANEVCVRRSVAKLTPAKLRQIRESVCSLIRSS
jgi:mRNA interferase MazF